MKSIKAVLLALLLGSSVFASAQGTQTEVTVEKDQTVSGKKTFSKGVTLGPILFSALTTTPPQTNGTIVAVSDASATSPCTGGGTGALAKRINGAWDCSGGGGGSLTFPLGEYYVLQNGLLCDGVTDDTAAFNTLLSTVSTAGGGTIKFPASTCVFAGQINVPNDGGAYVDSPGTVPANKPIRLVGQNAGALTAHLVGLTNNFGATILNMTFNASVAKILTLGTGYLEIDHITFEDTGSDCATFLLTTNTTLNFHDNNVLGSRASVDPVYSCNDAIWLGNASGTPSGTTNAPFQGYGTTIRNNYFNKVQRAVYGQYYANSNQITGNLVWSDAGFSTGAAFDFLANASFPAQNNVLTNNLCEMTNYRSCIRFGAATQYNTAIGNQCWDASTHGINFACVEAKDIAGAQVQTGNLVFGGQWVAAPGAYYFKTPNASYSAPFVLGPAAGFTNDFVGTVMHYSSNGYAALQYVGNTGLSGYIGSCGGSCAQAALQSNLFMWSPAHDTVFSGVNQHFYYNGSVTTEAMRIDSSGNITTFGKQFTIAPSANVGGSSSTFNVTGFLNDTNTAPLVNIDTPAGTSGPQQGSFRAGTNGFSQFQVCNSGNGAAAIGYNAFGATVACSGIYQTNPAKNVFMTGSNAHTLIRAWSAATAETVPLVQLNVASSGTGFNFLEGWSGVSGTDTYHTGGTNVWSIRGDGQFISTGGFDTSGAPQVKLPVGAGFVTTANGNQGYDSTNLNWHIWQNGADRINAVINGSPANNDCAKFVLSGSTISLQSAGAACGSGGGGLSGQTALGIPIAATATTSTSSTTPGTNQGTYLIGRINTVQGTATTPVEIQAGDCGAPGTISGATTTYTVVYTDVVGCNVVHDRAASGTATITLPTPTTLNNTAPIFVYSNYSPQNDTLTPTTWTISQGTSAAGASLTVNSGFACKVQPDPVNASTWKADCHQMTTSPSGGTVTSFSAGTLSPLFTTSVATATTTPALTFSLSNAAANTVFGNFTGSSAGPSFNAIAACGDATHALSWTAGTGLTCQNLAVPSAPVLWLPMATTGEPAIALATATGAGANTLSCIQFSVPTPITATKFVASVGTASGGQSVNVGIYDSSLNLIRDSGSLSCTTAGTAAVTSTVTSFSLNPGSTYYQCVAFTDATCALQGVAASTSFTNIANKNATREFTCANALSAGALPSACGTQTASSQKRYLVLLEQ